MSGPAFTDGALRGLYAALDAELEELGAKCAACGRCCRFEEFGHELWLTRAELDYLEARHGRRAVSERGICSYLEDGRCSAREGRSLSCRTFHCTLPRETVEELTNRYFEAVRALCREELRPLDYAELSWFLGSRRSAAAVE